MSHLVIFGLAGQTLLHVTPKRVASATYEITDLRKRQDDPDRVLATDPADVPAWSLTLDDNAGPSQPDGAKIPVTATAGPAQGDTAVITASDGAFEGVTIGAIETDDYITSTSILAGAYAPGSTVEGTTITAPVPIALYDFEDALDDQRPLRVEWRYTIGGAERRVTEPIQLSRQTEATASTGPALAFVRGRHPDMSMRLQQEQTLEGLGEAALKRVELDLVSRREDPAALMLGIQGEQLLAARIILEAAIGGYAPGMRNLADFISDSRTDYTTQLEAIAIGTPGGQAVKLDTDAVARERPSTTYGSPIGAM